MVSKNHDTVHDESTEAAGQQSTVGPPANKGELVVDATACPQDSNYPTDLNLLHDARKQSEKLPDILYDKVKLADEQK